MLPLFYDPVYTDGIDPSARFPRDRYRLLAERLGDAPEIDIRRPRRARRDELILAHDAGYVDHFLCGALPREAVRRIGLRPWTPQIVERTLRLTGGSLQALEHVLSSGGLAGNMAGGTHHAHHDFGSGYCIFNDLAVCAQVALKDRRIGRVLILDLDVHQGDGTAAIFEQIPEVFTCSMHCQSNFPFRKTVSDLDVPLDDDLGDGEFLAKLDELLDQLPSESFDLILFQAGVDGLEDDGLGRLKLSRSGLHARNERILELSERLGVPMVILMGGGYADPIERTVEAFDDLFRQAASRMRSDHRAAGAGR